MIPAMDIIDRMLTTSTIPTKNDTPTVQFSPAVKAALRQGQQTLNRYYSKTDESEVYRIAMSEHVTSN